MSAQAEDSIYVERGNFEQVPDALWKGGAVSPRAVVLYLALSKRGSREQRGVPKRSTIAKDMGVGSVRTVDTALDELIEKGWLLITPRLREDADQGQTSNHYHLLWTPITSSTDERLVKHQQAVEEFDRLMALKQEKNGTAGTRSVRRASWVPPVQDSAPPTVSVPAQFSAPSPRAENCAPPAQKTDTGPAQVSALQERDLLLTTPLKNQTKPSSAAGAPDREDDQLALIGEVQPSGPQPGFEDFYAIYPRHVGKQAARKAWDAAVRIASPAFIVEGARRFAADPNLPSKAEEQFIPHPSTWLRRGSWEDEPLPPRSGGRGKAYDDVETWGTEDDRERRAAAERARWEALSPEERRAEIARKFEGGSTAASTGR